MDNLIAERNFDSQATWVIDVLGLFVDVIHGYLYKEALADSRSTDAGIKRQYYIIFHCTRTLVRISIRHSQVLSTVIEYFSIS